MRYYFRCCHAVSDFLLNYYLSCGASSNSVPLIWSSLDIPDILTNCSFNAPVVANSGECEKLIP